MRAASGMSPHAPTAVSRGVQLHRGWRSSAAADGAGEAGAVSDGAGPPADASASQVVVTKGRTSAD